MPVQDSFTARVEQLLIRKTQQQQIQKLQNPEITSSSKNSLSQAPLSTPLPSVSQANSNTQQVGSRRTSYSITTKTENEHSNRTLNKTDVKPIPFNNENKDLKDPRIDHVSTKICSDSFPVTTFARLYYTRMFKLNNEKRNNAVNLETHEALKTGNFCCIYSPLFLSLSFSNH